MVLLTSPLTNISVTRPQWVNTLRPRQNGRHFAENIFKCIYLNENAWIYRKISLKFIPNVRIYNIPSLVQIMAWHRPGAKPFSEPIMVILSTHICVTRPQWVKKVKISDCIIISVGLSSCLSWLTTEKSWKLYKAVWTQFMLPISRLPVYSVPNVGNQADNDFKEFG